MPSSISELPATSKPQDSDLLEAARAPFAAGDSVHIPVGMLRLFMADPNGDWRDGCRFRTIGNVDLAGGGLADATTHDGVTAVTGDRALVMDQTDASENGLYPVPSSGAATRATDFDADAEVLNGAITYVFEGTAHARKAYIVTSADPHVVGTDDIIFAEHEPALGGAVAALQNGSSVVPAATAFDALSGVTFSDLGGNTVGVTAAGSGGGGSLALEEIVIDLSVSPQTETVIDVSGFEPTQMILEDVTLADATTHIALQMGTDASTFSTGASDYMTKRHQHSANTGLLDDRIPMAHAINDDEGFSAQVDLVNLLSPDLKSVVDGHAFHSTSAGTGTYHRLGQRVVAEVNSHIKITTYTGGVVITGGTVVVRGFRRTILWSQEFSGAADFEVKDLPTLDPNKSYQLRLRNVTTSVDSTELEIEFSSNNGALYKSAPLYQWGFTARAANSGILTDFADLATIGNISPDDASWLLGNSAGEAYACDIDLHGIADPAVYKCFNLRANYYAFSGVPIYLEGSIAYREAFNCDAIRIKPASGTFNGFA